jgi:hypothetical protein
MENACICRKDVSESTISRFLNKEGYYYLQARKKGFLTKADMKKRRSFARRMQNEYSHDVWTQDIAFYLDGTGFAYKRNPLQSSLGTQRQSMAQEKRRTNARMYCEGAKDRNWWSSGKADGSYKL